MRDGVMNQKHIIDSTAIIRKPEDKVFQRFRKCRLLLVWCLFLFVPVFAQIEKGGNGQPTASDELSTNTESLERTLKEKLKQSRYNYKVDKQKTIYRKSMMRKTVPREKAVINTNYVAFIFSKAQEAFHAGVVLFYRAIKNHDRLRTKFKNNTPYGLFHDRLFHLAYRNFTKAHSVMKMLKKYKLMNVNDNPDYKQLLLSLYKTMAIWEMYYGHDQKGIDFSNRVLEVNKEDIEAHKIRFLCADRIFQRLHRIDVKDKNPNFPMERYLNMKKLKNESLLLVCNQNYPEGNKLGKRLKEGFIEFNIRRSELLLKRYMERRESFVKKAREEHREKLKNRREQGTVKRPYDDPEKETEEKNDNPPDQNKPEPAK